VGKADAEKIVREISRDRKHGATHLAGRALDAMAISKSTGKSLENLRPSMPLIGAVVRMARKKGVPATRRELSGSLKKIVEHAREILPEKAKYILFSTSDTMEAVLAGVEGRRVKKLPADVALVGADAIYPDGSFVNAKGTADFVRKCRKAGAAVYVVASKLKKVRKEVSLETGFERVRGSLVHAILTESGLSYPDCGTLAGVEPTWLDRGPVSVRGTLGGRCHPHHHSG
jgi:translation initiation factor 2B subunit (eIF-2B alpha/beta/delta family)